MSKFILVVQKRLGMNKVVRTKSRRGSKFSKNIFGAIMQAMDCSCARVRPGTYCSFSIAFCILQFPMRRQMAPQ